MIVQDLVTIDSLCTFHVTHITTYICTEVNKENIYIILRADRQITKMIRINQALQLYKGITLSTIETAYTLKYMPYTLS